VALHRIERAVEHAVANEQFPGVLVVEEQAGLDTLPSTLVIWNPVGAAADAGGMPLVSELVVFCPDPAHPNALLEIRAPNVGTVAPAADDAAAWRTLTDNLKNSTTTNKVVLTDRLRTAPLVGDYSESLTPADLRGCVRFRRIMAPTQQQWEQYRAGSKTWQELDWPLDSYRLTSGTRTVVCQVELQIAPGSMAAAAATAIPFFGSGSISYELPR
jgi:hypothetical protein